MDQSDRLKSAASGGTVEEGESVQSKAVNALAAPRDELMGLPNGWRRARLGDVCTQDRRIIQPGTDEARVRPYLSLEHIESNTGRILRVPSAVVEDEGTSTTFAFDSRHVLYGKLRPYLNKVAMPDFEGRSTTELIPLLPADGMERSYLAWLLRRQETVDAAMREKTGSRMPRADMDDLFTMVVPLPPVADQRRIAAILHERMAAVDRARAAAEAQLAAARALPAAYLRAVFESDEAREWERVPLVRVANVSGGIQKTPNRTPSSFSRPYLTVRNVQRGSLDLANIEEFEVTASELAHYRLDPGDILIVEGNGSPDQIGRNAIFDAQIEDCVHQNHIIRVRLDRAKCLPEFVSLYLNSDVGKEQMLDKARSTTGLHTLSVSKIEQVVVAMPSLPNQRHVALALRDRAELATQVRQALQAQLDAINQLPAALLRQAFNGEL